ncbi:MAG: aminotransferase class IV [Vulcanimicrobiota bacterium]
MAAPDLDQMWVRLDGQNLPMQQATVPVSDHGFLYGDSVYETLRSFGGRVFELDAHLARLRRSAAGLYLTVPWSDEHLSAELEALRSALPQGDHYLRMLVTRGSGRVGYAFNPDQQPRLVILGGPIDNFVVRGLSATIVPIRRLARETVSPALKTSNLLNLRLAFLQAQQAGFDEAILLNPQGQLTEASTSNFFAVIAGRLFTPALEAGILEGITRRVILELAAELGLAVDEGFLTLEQLPTLDEAFLTSTTRSLAPLACLDDHRMPAPGPVTGRLIEAFRARAGGL